MSVTEFFEHPTIKELAQYLTGAEESIYAGIQPVLGREYYPVSSAQKRLYALNQLEGINMSYNSPGMLTVPGSLDRVFIEQAVRTLVKRHESFRTSFALLDGEIVQKIHEDVELSFFYAEGTPAEVENHISQFMQTFDLGTAPLLRFGMVKTPEVTYLLFDMHHIISDGASGIIFVRDLFTLLQGGTLPELRIQYKDFAVWQNNFLQSDEIREQEAFWLKKFSGQIPVLNLPTDFPRGENVGFAGDLYKFELEQELAAALHQMAQKKGVTLYMLMLTAFSIVLAKYSQQDDLVIGSPTAGRPHADLEHVIGIFINILPLRTQPGKDKTIANFLQEVKTNVLESFEHQDYQLEMLVDKLGLQRDLARNPLFDVTFVLQNHRLDDLVPDDQFINPFDFNTHTAKFDITLTAFESKGRILCNLEYKTGLFTAETMERLAANYQRVLQATVGAEDTLIKEIQLDVEYKVLEDAPIDDVDFTF